GAGEEHVAGDLLLNESPIGLILVEGADDVIAVRPGVGAGLVLVVAVGVAVVDHVEPVSAPPLAAGRRGQPPVPAALVRGRRGGGRRGGGGGAGGSGRRPAGGGACAGRPRARGPAPARAAPG